MLWPLAHPAFGGYFNKPDCCRGAHPGQIKSGWHAPIPTRACLAKGLQARTKCIRLGTDCDWTFFEPRRPESRPRGAGSANACSPNLVSAGNHPRGFDWLFIPRRFATAGTGLDSRRQLLPRLFRSALFCICAVAALKAPIGDAGGGLRAPYPMAT